MSAAQFTQGPWRLNYRTSVFDAEPYFSGVVDALGQHILVDGVVLTCTPVARANARLIAAAPELLAALEELLFYSDAMKGTNTHRRCVGAITKATGSAL